METPSGHTTAPGESSVWLHTLDCSIYFSFSFFSTFLDLSLFLPTSQMLMVFFSLHGRKIYILEMFLYISVFTGGESCFLFFSTKGWTSVCQMISQCSPCTQSSPLSSFNVSLLYSAESAGASVSGVL